MCNNPNLIIAILRRPHHPKDGARKKLTPQCPGCIYYRLVHSIPLCGIGEDFRWLVNNDNGNEPPICTDLLRSFTESTYAPAIHYLDRISDHG